MTTIRIRGYNRNLWQIAGGMLDSELDIINNKISPEKCIERENSEELCKLNIYDYKFLGIFIHYGHGFATIAYSAKCKESSKEIKLKHNKQDKTIIDFDELPEIKFIKLNENFLTETQERYTITDSTLATMLSYWNHKLVITIKNILIKFLELIIALN